MGRRLLRHLVLATALVPWLAATGAAQTRATYQENAPEPSMATKFSSSVKNGFSKVTGALIPKPSAKEAPDPISLSVPAEPSADFHVAVARMAEASDPAKAEFHYRQALELEPKHFDALLGYAHLLDRQDKLSQACQIYQLLVKSHPSNPTAHNDLGICCARQGKLQEAVASIDKAIQLDPKQARYRNNMATILVQSNQVEQAFAQLNAVHSRSVACYNLAYLLQKAGDKEAATRLFQEALALDPSMVQARVWLEHLRPPVPIAAGAVPPQMAAGPTRQPQTLAQRSATSPTRAVPQPGSAVVQPSAGPSAALPRIPMAGAAPAAGQEPPRQLAPLPSIRPLPPIQGGN